MEMNQKDLNQVSKQLSIFDRMEEIKRKEEFYLNGLGQPLPWEQEAYDRQNDLQAIF